MAFLRRSTAAILLACCVLLLLYRFRLNHSNDNVLVPESTGFEETTTSTTTTGTFRWSNLKTRYPVKSYTPLPTGPPKQLPRIQAHFEDLSLDAEEEEVREHRRAAVKQAFARCWKAYRENAWLSDELAPLSGTAKTTFGGWAATLVDSLDTLWIMDMKEEFYEAVGALDQIDFTTSTGGQINVFETTIRYLGGFISAYDLSAEQTLLDKAVEMAEMLYVAFDTPNRLPITRWDFEAARRGDAQIAPDWVLSAEIGSLSLEFTRLSQLTGDPRWYDAVARVTRVFAEQQPRTKLPGMWPIVVDAHTQDFTRDNTFSLGAMADSLYEYFPKMHALLGGLEPIYERLYTSAITTASRNLFFKPMTPTNEDILISGIYHHRPESDSTTEPALEPQGQHLVCFVGGMLALGSRLFDLPSHLLLAHQLLDGCTWAYRIHPSGLMPEVFHALPCPTTTPSTPCTWNNTAWLNAAYTTNNIDEQTRRTEPPADTIARLGLQPGITLVADSRYILRPETIESVFILYRTTGRRDLLDTAWSMFEAIQRATETDLANAAVGDMTGRGAWRDIKDAAESGARREGGTGAAAKQRVLVQEAVRASRMDSMESFWMAETLKYFYLIFSEEGLISLDEWTFNTEAHPLRRPSAGAVF